MIHFLKRTAARITLRRNQLLQWLRAFLARQLTWRNIVRACGLAGMMYLVLTKDHPDATALVALGTMIGLPTFFWLDPAVVGQRPTADTTEPDKPLSEPPLPFPPTRDQ